MLDRTTTPHPQLMGLGHWACFVASVKARVYCFVLELASYLSYGRTDAGKMRSLARPSLWKHSSVNKLGFRSTLCISGSRGDHSSAWKQPNNLN